MWQGRAGRTAGWLILRFLSDEQIDFDVDLRELQGQGRLDVLCGFLSAIGRRLGKSVPLFPEGGGTQPLLGFDTTAGKVRVMWSAPDECGGAIPPKSAAHLR
ncbi:hypothetical protein [Kitasatospora sp. LaBMicrA B282]|uniref:hypothetical protein n=1 Tax=Kitasatospora sp. LaBMicrA B282 TaxID=3420949 RepID=UPI003D0ABE07